jgi:hypothetical protein
LLLQSAKGGRRSVRFADFLAIKIWGLLEEIQSIGNKLAFFLSCGKKCTLLENYFKAMFKFLFGC